MRGTFDCIRYWSKKDSCYCQDTVPWPLYIYTFTEWTLPCWMQKTHPLHMMHPIALNRGQWLLSFGMMHWWLVVWLGYHITWLVTYIHCLSIFHSWFHIFLLPWRKFNLAKSQAESNLADLSARLCISWIVWYSQGRTMFEGVQGDQKLQKWCHSAYALLRYSHSSVISKIFKGAYSKILGKIISFSFLKLADMVTFPTSISSKV